MDGSPAVTPADLVDQVVAGVPRSPRLENLLASARAHDAEAEAQLKLLRELEAESEGAPHHEERTRKARLARVAALAAASKARIAGAPLLEAYRDDLVTALEPIAEREQEAIAEELEMMAARLAPRIAAHNKIAQAIGRAGGVRLGLPRPGLPDGFTQLLAVLERFAASRARQIAAGGRRRRTLGRRA